MLYIKCSGGVIIEGWAIRTLSSKYQGSVFWLQITASDHRCTDTEAGHHFFQPPLAKVASQRFKGTVGFSPLSPLLGARHLGIRTFKNNWYTHNMREFRKSLHKPRERCELIRDRSEPSFLKTRFLPLGGKRFARNGIHKGKHSSQKKVNVWGQELTDPMPRRGLASNRCPWRTRHEWV